MNSPHTNETHEIACPNCGFHADRNYCAQCGQPTHLHEESFWGMVMHFVGHYFHYDSKFWKTLVTLWFKPGMLTKAYLQKQRMRFIPPISLYIFITAVFFLIMFSVKHESPGPRVLRSANATADSIDNASALAIPGGELTVDTAGFVSEFFERKFRKVEMEHGKEGAGKYVFEKFKHNFPKLFFFLIPVVALVLKLLFLRRRSLKFVHHAVFSLHIHSFFFSILLLGLINPFPGLVATVMTLLIIVAGPIYCIIAIRRFYEVSYLRAILSTIIIGFGYSLSFAIAAVVTLFFIVAMS